MSLREQPRSRAMDAGNTTNCIPPGSRASPASAFSPMHPKAPGSGGGNSPQATKEVFKATLGYGVIAPVLFLHSESCSKPAMASLHRGGEGSFHQFPNHCGLERALPDCLQVRACPRAPPLSGLQPSLPSAPQGYTGFKAHPPATFPKSDLTRNGHSAQETVFYLVRSHVHWATGKEEKQ